MIYDAFIPVATSWAGRTLTWKNWGDCGVRTLTFELDALLIKPGTDILNNFPSLQHYTGWSGKHVLNANSSGKHSNGFLQVKSNFDGTVLKIPYDALCELIVHLGPDDVIIPLWLEEAWFAHQRTKKIVAWFTEQKTVFQSSRDKSMRYVIEPEMEKEPFSASVVLFESDKPAQDATDGQIYTHDGILNLYSSIYELAMMPLCKNCACQVCKSGLTRAYLHHLIQHTPLLAQRYLIIHNVYHKANMAKQNLYV